MLIHSCCFGKRRALLAVLGLVWVFILLRHLGIGSIRDVNGADAEWEVGALGVADRMPFLGGVFESGVGEDGPIDDDALRSEFQQTYDAGSSPYQETSLYGSTLATIIDKTSRWRRLKSLYKPAEKAPTYTSQVPSSFDPYPDYNSWRWWNSGRGTYVACEGVSDDSIADMQVFHGRPSRFPEPGTGSYRVLGLDGDLCWERETRLGRYGLNPQLKDGKLIDWDAVDWSALQRKCIAKNSHRFDFSPRENEWLSLYPSSPRGGRAGQEKGDAGQKWKEFVLGLGSDTNHEYEAYDFEIVEDDEIGDLRKRTWDASTLFTPRRPRARVSESRTAILLRTYTGKEYTENDKQVIRSLITELALRTGGEYEVFLLVHVKDRNIDISDRESRKKILDEQIPPEFHNITVMWTDEFLSRMYTALEDAEARDVNYGQWMSVQWFSMQRPEFDFFWNWEIDTRYTGHHYDLLQKLDDFARRQPRKGLWERNDRFYIEAIHGDYDTTFRNMVETLSGNDTVWGPPPIPVVKPVGPKPPVADPKDDDYEWGVGEDADLITLGPIFNVLGSEWIYDNHVWGFDDDGHDGWSIPRRGTIITHSKVSKRLLDLMHVENLRGNHVVSEMTPQTVALLHGLKAVFAPHPVFFDRPWDGRFMDRWFNPGPKGTVGGRGSSVGWGRERRYQGSTWYYRAEPPNRLYNNWLGFEDTGLGGERWEGFHGRTCLPPMVLHPVKDTKETPPGYRTWYDIY